MDQFPIMAVFPAATVLGIVAHLAFTRRERTAAFVFGVIISWAIAINIGAAGLLAFFAHAFRPDETAAFIGWPAGNPFQFEVAVANLAFGVLGVLSIWMRSTFRFATVLGYSIFLIGAAFGHLQQMQAAGNMAPGNAGAPLYVDIIAPPVLLALWTIQYVIAKRGVAPRDTSSTGSLVP